MLSDEDEFMKYVFLDLSFVYFCVMKREWLIMISYLGSIICCGEILVLVK